MKAPEALKRLARDCDYAVKIPSSFLRNSKKNCVVGVWDFGKIETFEILETYNLGTCDC